MKCNERKTKIFHEKKFFYPRIFFNSLFFLFFLFPPFGGIEGGCQDIHFSQFQQTPLLVNPALAGNFNGDQRVLLNYKNQWKSVGSPYTTFAFSGDAGWLKRKWKSAYFGTGINIFSDKAGDSNLGITQYNLAMSCIVALTERNRISAGIQGGWAQRSIGSTNMIWDNQITGISVDPSLPSGEMNGIPAFHYSDVAAGMIWSYDAIETGIFNNNMFGMYAGVAAYHLNRPNQEFYSTERLNEKFVATSGARIGLKNSNISLLPSILLMKQGKTNETNFGMMYRYTLREESKYTGILKGMAVSIGGYYRIKDAVVPSLLYEFANYSIGITYDVNISKLRMASKAQGGIEIALRYINPNPFNARQSVSKSVRFL